MRRFVDDALGLEYAAFEERISDRSVIVRIAGATTEYLEKEQLWRELPHLADALERHIKSSTRPPDLLHAHYADAGWLAAEMKRRMGIPFIFTAHSLGRIKAQMHEGSQQWDAPLARRIELEERAICDADRIVASSRDEAQVQYGLYASARPERIRVIPPGCDLDAFSPTIQPLAGHRLLSDIERFLSQPALPPVLAIARPVRRKNLAGLVRAYGEHPTLRNQANLIIVAGNREDILARSTEEAEVLHELLLLVDRYDLWGRVALPKRHEPGEVPAVYARAAAMGGVFVNLAYHEPFGLTLLEATASGLPVVATNRGGPNDIVARCQNGLLVEPASTTACGDAIGALLNDSELWGACSASGLRNIGYYRWSSHARRYAGEVNAILGRAPARRSPPASFRTWLLVSDLDGTLIGDGAALEEFARWRSRDRSFRFAIATGRDLYDAVDVLLAWKAPVPEVLITSAGSEIYHVLDEVLCDFRADHEWTQWIDQDWDPGAIGARLALVAGLAPQPEREQRRFKRSYFVAHPNVVQEVERRLADSGLTVTILCSHGRFLDILPARASKGHALRFLAEAFRIPVNNVIAAGDAGNDLPMLQAAGHAVIVANYNPEIASIRSARHAHFATKPYAGGVLEGVERITLPRTR